MRSNPHQVYAKICDVMIMLERIRSLAQLYGVSEIASLSSECINTLKEALRAL
jgi:hypothetical protein